MISLIVAVAENNVIGKDGDLPWYLPDDLCYFRRVTQGKPVIMGRKNFESIKARIGGPLPKRPNIVISRQADWQSEGVEVVGSLEDAIALASMQALQGGDDEVFIIGGGQIYKQALADNLVDKIYFTRVQAEVAGDVFFPEVDWGQWQEVSREEHAADGDHEYGFSFVVYEKV